MSKNIKMNKDNLNNKFDIKEPNLGHFDRFEAKLKEINKPIPSVVKTKQFSKYKYLAIAASFVLLFGIAFVLLQPNANKGVELAEISPKMEETQDYFTSVIREELEKINKVKTEENAQIINDAFVQLNGLEKNYKKLTLELKENNNGKQIIFAMINNYQQRIDVLRNLLDNLDNFKQLKNIENENTII